MKKKVLLLFLHERHREVFLGGDNVLSSAFTTLHLNERKKEEEDDDDEKGKDFFANVIPTTTERKRDDDLL